MDRSLIDGRVLFLVSLVVSQQTTFYLKKGLSFAMGIGRIAYINS